MRSGSGALSTRGTNLRFGRLISAWVVSALVFFLSGLGASVSVSVVYWKVAQSLSRNYPGKSIRRASRFGPSWWAVLALSRIGRGSFWPV